MTVNTATAVWEGSVRDGAGRIAFASKAFEGPYSFRSRTEAGTGNTNPEELIAAAHAGCFTMALSARLSQAGTPPTHLETVAHVTLDATPGAFTISKIVLSVTGSVPGLDAAAFEAHAHEAKATCPVSKALAGVPDISLEVAFQG